MGQHFSQLRCLWPVRCAAPGGEVTVKPAFAPLAELPVEVVLEVFERAAEATPWMPRDQVHQVLAGLEAPPHEEQAEEAPRRCILDMPVDPTHEAWLLQMKGAIELFTGPHGMVDVFALLAAMALCGRCHHVTKVLLLFSLADLGSERKLGLVHLHMLVRSACHGLGAVSAALAPLRELRRHALEHLVDDILASCGRKRSEAVPFDEFLFCCLRCERLVFLLNELPVDNATRVIDAPVSFRAHLKQQQEDEKKKQEEERKLARPSKPPKLAPEGGQQLRARISPWANHAPVSLDDEVQPGTRARSPSPPPRPATAMAALGGPAEEADELPPRPATSLDRPARKKYWWVQPRPRRRCNSACTQHELRALLAFFTKPESEWAQGTNVVDRRVLSTYIKKAAVPRLRRDEIYYPITRPGVQEGLEKQAGNMSFAEFLCIVYRTASPQALAELCRWAMQAKAVEATRELWADQENQTPVAELARVLLHGLDADGNGFVTTGQLVGWGLADRAVLLSWLDEHRPDLAYQFQEGDLVLDAPKLAELSAFMRQHQRSPGKLHTPGKQAARAVRPSMHA